MTISKNVATGMCYIGGLLGVVPPLAVMSFSPRSSEIIASSEYHNRLKQIETELPALEHKVADCMPVIRTLPTQECVDLKVQYNAMRQEQADIPESQGYIAVETEVQNVFDRNVYSALAPLVAGFILVAAGMIINQERRREEELVLLEAKMEREEKLLSSYLSKIYQKQGEQ